MLLRFMFQTHSSLSTLVITSRWFATSRLEAPVSVRLVYYLPMLGLKLIHVSKRGHWTNIGAGHALLPEHKKTSPETMMIY